MATRKKSGAKATTLKGAKAYVKANFKHGVVCPCCEQYVKLYQRKLNSGMAMALIRIYKKSPTDWLEVKDFFRQYRYHNGHDWTLLRHWGLLVEKIQTERKGKQKCSGIWKITQKGIDFILGKTTVPKFLLMYNQIGYGLMGADITILDALTSKFNYDELMQS